MTLRLINLDHSFSKWGSLLLILNEIIDFINNQMSGQQSQYIVNNGRRFEVYISNYSKVQGYIVYQAIILDTAFLISYPLYFRFRSLSKLHDQMSKQLPNQLPDFPKTKSFCLWNKTNSSPKLIQDRIRDLQYYLTKLLNNSILLKLPQLRYIIKTSHMNKQKRSLSQTHRYSSNVSKAYPRECPELYRKQNMGISLL